MSNSWFVGSDKNHSKDIVGNIGQKLFKKDSTGYPAETNIVMPPTNEWANIKLHIPNTSIPNNFNGGRIDFNLNAEGFTREMIIKVEVTNTGGAAINFLPHFMLEKYEVLQSNGSVGSTHYDDNIYLDKIHQSFEEVLKLVRAENISITTYNANATIAAGATGRYYLKLPSILDSSEIIIRSLRDGKLALRFYLQNRCTDTPASLQLNKFEVITRGMTLETSHLNMETADRSKNLWKYRYLEPVRQTQSISNVAINSQYEIKLTSFIGYSAYLVLLIRPSARTYANQNVYQGIDRIELIDGNGAIVGITQDDLFLNTKITENFRGHIFNVKDNLYVIPFSIDVLKGRRGMVTGYYKFNSTEQLKIYTGSDIVPGSYEFVVYSYDYHILEINNGDLTTHK